MNFQIILDSSFISLTNSYYYTINYGGQPISLNYFYCLIYCFLLSLLFRLYIFHYIFFCFSLYLTIKKQKSCQNDFVCTVQATFSKISYTTTKEKDTLHSLGLGSPKTPNCDIFNIHLIQIRMQKQPADTI